MAFYRCYEKIKSIIVYICEMCDVKSKTELKGTKLKHRRQLFEF